MSTPITTSGTYQFKNRTNGDILIQRVYFDDYTYFSIDTDGLIPGGAKKNTLTLDNQISKTSNSTGSFTWLVGDTNGGYNQAKYSTTSAFPGWVQKVPNGWPLMGWSPSGSNWMMHPQRNDGDRGTEHYTCILRWVADADGKVSVRSKIEHRGGGYGAVNGMVVHCMRGSSSSKPDPNNYVQNGKTYINSLNWNAVSGVGYTRQAFGDVLGTGGPIQANLISNWHPRKMLSNASGGIMSPAQKRSSAGTSWSTSPDHTSLIVGNTDRSTPVTTEVRGPHYAFSGGQGGYEPLKCRYIRWFPMRWRSHPTARVGAYNTAEGWNLGTSATLTSNSIWENRHDHSPTYAQLNDTRAHSNWSTLNGHDREGQEGTAYIQQDFGSVKEVTHIASQGRHNYDQWVTQWMIFASKDGTNWHPVTTNSGGPWNPDSFTKEVTVKAGDWIDMIVEAGDISSAYDSTYVDHNITYTASGSGDNAQQYIDSNGYIRNSTTDNIDGIELPHNEQIAIPVKSPTTSTSFKGHKIHTTGTNLKVDYKCDKLLDSGSSTAFFDAISPETHEVKNLDAANWFEIISKATGKSMTLYIPSQMLAGKGLRWAFSIDFGWIYISAKLNPFDITGCWIYKAASSTSGGTQNRGWMWLVLDHLPRLYVHTGPHKWFMLGKTGAQSYKSPCWIYAEHVQTSQSVNQLRYRYKIYQDFLKSGWGTPVEKSYISTGTSTNRNDPDIVSKIPPDHTRAGIELGFGASKSDWWQNTTDPTLGAVDVSKSAMYRVNKSATMPLTKMWMESETSGAIPETVAFMCRENGTGGNWILMYRYSNWSDRVNGFNVWKSLDGNHKMQLEGSNNNSLYWTIHTNGRKYIYRPDDGMEKVEMVFNGATVYADKFPADGSYCYRNKIAGISHGGKWVPVPGPSHETMLYFIYHKTNERSKFINSLNESSGSTATSLGLEMTGRPDIRGRNINSSSFGYLRAFDYDFTTLNDSMGPDRSSNSRLILFLTNCKSNGSTTVDTTPIIVRETHATIDCSAATTSGGATLEPGTYMRCKAVYPGYNSTTYRESNLFGVGKTPVPQLQVDVYPEGKHFNQNGYVIASAKYQNPTTGYMDCGYDTKSLARINGNGYTEIIGNLPPEQSGGPTRSGQAWLGLKVENGNSKNPGTIIYNAEKLKAADYNISMFNYGDQDNYTWINNMSQHLDIQIPVHSIGHLGAKFMAYGPSSGQGANATHTLLYGGNEDFGTWNTTNQCCDSNGFNVTNDKNCLDYKTPVLNDPGQIMYREGRNASKWDVMNVRYVDHAYKSGAIQFRADSGPYKGAYTRGRWQWGWETSYRDTNGPTRLKFHNWHPFSSVWVHIQARVAWASDDAAGLTIGAWSDTRGKIFDPFDHNSAYLYCSWDGYDMWPHTFGGGDFGAVSPGSSTGVHNFVGGRSGLAAVINTTNGNGAGVITTKSFGYFRIQPGETMTFALYGGCNLSCHDGYGQLEGTMANWFKLSPHSWPEDPD